MFHLISLFSLVSSSTTCLKDEYEPLYEKSTFTLPKLPYTYDSLNPQYWDQLVYYHHDKVHKDLIDSLNSYISENTKYSDLTIIDLLQDYASNDYTLWRWAGGHYSHTLFWQSLYSYKCADELGTSELLYKIEGKWGSFEEFKEEFSGFAKGLYGSGWVWLCIDLDGELVIKAKSEEFNPLGQGLIPIVGIDVWEHAYEFFYRWDRNDYVDAWWEIIDWGLISYLFDEYCSKLVPIPI